MHLSVLYTTFLLLFLLLPKSFAAPTSDIQATTTAHALSTNDTLHHPTSTESHHKSSSRPFHIIPTNVATHLTFSRPPPPTHTPSANNHPNHPPPDHPPSNHRQKPVAIFFEVVGGIAGFVFLLGLMRCLYSYKRTPSRDRVAAFVNRHRLQREMEELERNPPVVRRTSLHEPPPPAYFPPPPEYLEVNSTNPTTTPTPPIPPAPAPPNG